MKKLANIISFGFSPLIVPIYGLVLLFFLPLKSVSFISVNSLYLYPFAAKIVFLSLFVVFVFLGPLLSLVVLRKNNTIQSLFSLQQEERNTPLVVISIYYVILASFLIYQMKTILIPPLLIGIAAGGALSVIVAFFINKKRKIDLHSTAMGGLLGLFYMYILILTTIPLYLLLAILFLGAVIMMSRLTLKNHSLFEVGCGYFVGFFMQVIAIYTTQFILIH